MTMVDLLFRGRRLVFETALSNREVTERLQREVAPPRWGACETRTQLFEGTFSEGRFRLEAAKATRLLERLLDAKPSIRATPAR